MPHLPVRIPGSRLDSLTRDVPPEVFTQEFRDACERLDRFIGALVLELASSLDLPDRETVTAGELLAHRGWSEAGGLALTWLIETLEAYGHAVKEPSGYALSLALPDQPSAAIRDQALAAVPTAAPAYHLLELCGSALPAILRGEKVGEELLGGPAGLALWLDYFSNENPHYALNNSLAALAVAQVANAGAAVIEVGGGGGSAAAAILSALTNAGKSPATYTFTELHPAFLRRGSRVARLALPPGSALHALAYDMDREPQSQGLPLGQSDIVVAVNTVHLACDIRRTLTWMRSLLRPGGHVVLGELMRPTAEGGVHLEMPFALLEAYRAAPVIPGIRLRPGFLALSGWQRALAEAGFNGFRIVPGDFEECCKLYPGFYCGAVIAAAP